MLPLSHILVSLKHVATKMFLEIREDVKSTWRQIRTYIQYRTNSPTGNVAGVSESQLSCVGTRCHGEAT